eukprot:scaffold181388_cov28-Tisochrysis_lutea.AAC.4
MPIAVGVFAQMLGEGIAISSLPLHMTNLGASPVLAGAATSCFSIAQMFCCPLLVRLSSRVGRLLVLRVCLAGATASSLIIALSGTTLGIITGRSLAGVFAASIPVAQAAVTDAVVANETALALSRVSASSQLGVVVGPAAAAIFQSVYAMLGVPPHLRLRAVFLTSGAFALGVLGLLLHGGDAPPAAPVTSAPLSPKREPADAGARGSAASAPPAVPSSVAAAWPLTQPCLRLIAGLVGWGLTLSVGTYGLFAPRFLGEVARAFGWSCAHRDVAWPGMARRSEHEPRALQRSSTVRPRPCAP